MRIKTLWIVAFSVALVASAVYGNDSLAPSVSSAELPSVWQSAFDLGRYAPGETGARDAVIPCGGETSCGNECTTDFTSLGSGASGCGSGCCGGCQCQCHDSLCQLWLDRDPFKLPQPSFLERHGIHAGGWVQAGITLNAEHPSDGFNGPLLTNDQDRDVQMNQLWLYLHRPVDTGGSGVDIGGRVDFFYGTDWRVAYLHSFGLEGDLSGSKLNGSNQLYGVSFPQFYGEIAIDNLSVKLGHMTGILGYEIVPPMGNFFYSHSYALSYGEPILITGAMATYKASDQVKILAGLHQGIHQFSHGNGSVSFQGGIFWNSCDERLSIGYALDVGRNDFIFPLEDEFVQSLVVKYQVTPDLLYVFQNDVGWAEGAAGAADAEWYGVNQYLFYTLSETISAGIRFEWFRDDDGTRVLGLGNLDAQGWSAPQGTPGFAGSFTELTMGLNIKPKSNISIRPELRWDWYDGSTNGGGALPFDAGLSDRQFTFATDFILTF